MARRALTAMLLVALGALGAAWFAQGTFTMRRSVSLSPPVALDSSIPAQTERAEMRIECTPTSGHYVTERGDRMFFDLVSPAPESPNPLCDAARSQRRLTAVAFLVIGLLGGEAVLVLGRVRDRRAAELVPGKPAQG